MLPLLSTLLLHLQHYQVYRLCFAGNCVTNMLNIYQPITVTVSFPSGYGYYCRLLCISHSYVSKFTEFKISCVKSHLSQLLRVSAISYTFSSHQTDVLVLIACSRAISILSRIQHAQLFLYQLGTVNQVVILFDQVYQINLLLIQLIKISRHVPLRDMKIYKFNKNV